MGLLRLNGAQKIRIFQRQIQAGREIDSNLLTGNYIPDKETVFGFVIQARHSASKV